MVLIDFEYNRSADPDMGLVCCCLQQNDSPIERYWLDDGSETDALKARLIELYEQDETFVGYAIQLAECRCFVALGLDPRMFKWRDLFSEYKWLANADDRWQYGQFTYSASPKSDPVPVYRFKPSVRQKKRMSAEEEALMKETQDAEIAFEEASRGIKCVVQKCDQSLLSIEYHYDLLDENEVIEDVRVKKETRKKILNGFRLDLCKDEILDYCSSDIHLLGDLANLIEQDIRTVMAEPHLILVRGVIKELCPDELNSPEDFMLYLGHWCAQNARYAMRGIPLDKDRLEAVLAAAPYLTLEEQFRWNTTHPEYPLYRVGPSAKDLAGAKLMKQRSPYKKMEVHADNDLFAQFAHAMEVKGEFEWKRTSSGDFAADGEYLKELSGKSEDDPIYCYRKHKDKIASAKALSKDESGEVAIMQFIGSDYVQRPNFNPFGTKTGRNAPSAKSYLFLQSKYLRALVNPRKGTQLTDIDVHAEEIGVAASVFDDDVKREGYKQPCFYMFYAQKAGAYPADKPILTEQERDTLPWWKEEGWGNVRKQYKGGCLGMQFGMGGAKLRQRVLLSLPKDKRDEIDEDWGDRFVDTYHATFQNEYQVVTALKEAYSDKHMGLMLVDGWRLGPDEENILTVSNFPIQGSGAVILRKACQLCDGAGVRIYSTLHDAISFISDESEKKVPYDPSDENSPLVCESIAKARACLIEACKDVLGEDLIMMGMPETIHNGDFWFHGDNAKPDWNAVAEKHFPQFKVI